MAARVDIPDFLKDLSPDSLLAVGEKGLYRLKCPFYVVALADFEHIKKSEAACVSLIQMNVGCPLLYMIKGRLYEYRFFRLV